MIGISLLYLRLKLILRSVSDEEAKSDVLLATSQLSLRHNIYEDILNDKETKGWRDGI